MDNSVTEILSILFGAGGIGFALISRWLDRKKYAQEVRQEKSAADIKGDEFWKARYDVLNEEMKSKDIWWKDRYDNLYQEFQDERKLSNEIREDYERQKEIDKTKYDELMAKYTEYQKEVELKSKEQIDRINQLEKLVAEYEKKLKRQ